MTSVERRFRFVFGALVVASLVFVVPSIAGATPITTVFATGVNATGTPLPDASLDPHYTVNGNPAIVIGCPGCVGWVGNTSTAEWISASRDTRAGAGPFTYETVFDLTGFEPTNVVIRGIMAADDQASFILNGVHVFDSQPDALQPWSHYEPIAINSGFVAGINTLQIVVPNNIEGVNDGPTGLLLDIQATSVPEPASMVLLGTGLAAGLARRKKRAAR